MKHYYECNNILNNCCDKYRKPCKKSKKKRHHYKCSPNECPNYYYNYNQNFMNPSNYHSETCPDNMIMLLFIILLISGNCSNDYCD